MKTFLKKKDLDTYVDELNIFLTEKGMSLIEGGRNVEVPTDWGSNSNYSESTYEPPRRPIDFPDGV